jgi:hypothetical protein
MIKGSFILSLDYELFWGVYEKKKIKNYINSNIVNANYALIKICELAERYDIKVSIGIVGLLNADYSSNISSVVNAKAKSTSFWLENKESLAIENLIELTKIYGDPELIKTLLLRKNVEIVRHT